MGVVSRTRILAGQIERAHEELRQMILALEHLDATIQQFDPDYKVEAIRPKAFRPPKDWANRGEMTRICLNILRQAKEPRRGLSAPDRTGAEQGRPDAHADDDEACRRRAAAPASARRCPL
jgi:hypothetical protein